MPQSFVIRDRIYTIDQIIEVVKSNEIRLIIDPKVIRKVEQNRRFLDEKLDTKGALYYGINTGFGSLCNVQIGKGELKALQENLVRSHACGAGAALETEVCKLIFLLKIINLSKACSGITITLLEHMVNLYNAGLTPVIFEQGSLGASGDLAPLAHLSLMLIGEGECTYKGKTEVVSRVMKKLGLEPITLQAKEGLALLNGTQFSLAHSMIAVHKSRQAVKYTTQIACMSLEAFACSRQPFHPTVARIRNNADQAFIAAEILSMLKDSKIAGKRIYSVQDPYSFRCIPQVHGASYTAIQHVAQVVENELNAVTDNPNVLHEENMIISAGNFHAQNLALVIDYLSIALSELANISERRTYQLIHGERDLPAYLTQTPGLSSGFMIAQYTAASVVSQNKQLSTPSSVDSIVSSRGQEDHVSMAANGATRLLKICDNLNTVYAIELMVSAQALDFRGVESSGKRTRNLHAIVRKQIPFLKEDRALHFDIKKAKNILNLLN
ncbi:MAG: histidine ammonia-lyase [Saprospiraceae bacterium]|nr:histidine ammonia-lyase [Saprospiraceae bacterium]